MLLLSTSLSRFQAVAGAFLAATSLAAALLAQSAPTPRAPEARAPRPPRIVSPEVLPDRRVTFRLLAPQAQAVTLNPGDIKDLPPEATRFTKNESGVWELTVGPLVPGAYRYTFNVDGVPATDPANPATTEAIDTAWSYFPLPGNPLMDTREVPHGAVSSITYYSTALQRFRRMQIYTPPGYGLGSTKYPVFYLLHGSGDCDTIWPNIGRAGFILDNLIAEKKAKPMIVVMPAGHTTLNGVRGSSDEFIRDFETDILTYVEKNYRVLTDRSHRAIAGLSMGGGQTLNLSMGHLDRYAYIGVFSSGLSGRPNGQNWEEQHQATLDNPSLKKGLKLFWFATGKDDRVIDSTRKTVEMFKTHGFNPVFIETSGAHTFLNWRNYLIEFAPRLFQ